MSSFNVTHIKPFIGSKNYDESKDFYQAIGWTMTFDSAEIAEMQLGNNFFYLQRYYERKWCQNSMMYITVDDAQAWYERIKSVLEKQKFGAAKVNPPQEQSYGALVTFVWDPVGVLLHFAQPIETDN